MITYLFGAGASYNAIPVVKGMDSRIQAMFLYFESYFKIVVNEDIVNLSNEIRENYSIDTLARKFFLKGRNKDLIKLKSLLSAYILWEQIVKPEDNSVAIHIDKVNIRQDSYLLHTNRFNYRIKGNLRNRNSFLNSLNDEDEIIKNYDYRYESFFSAIAEGQHLLDSKYNFISWNYDNQVEIALSRIFNFHKHDESSRNREMHTILDNRFYKLNGSAGISNFDFEPLSRFAQEDKKHNLEGISSFLNGNDKEFENRIYFAWEYPREFERHRCKDIIVNTEILVIIGYSFPQYNRKIDSEIFNCINEKKIKKIIVQDTSQNVSNIVQRIEAILPHGINVKPIPYTDLELFYIPE